ncbi:MAG: NERD domain-containing protein [Firmicutes bacterium]|nr:NERD domain-containing protein [Candidatus Colimorpha enterica]
MEAISKIFITLIVLTVIALVVIGSGLIAWRINTKKKITALFAKKNRSESFVPSLIKAQMLRPVLIRNAVLPEPVGNGSFVNANADLIYISHGGIAVMSLIGIPGAVDNSGTGDWTIQNNTGVTTIPNPLEANAHAVNAILQILKENSVFNVPIYNFAVFYGKKTVFRVKSNKLLTAKTLLPSLKDINRDKFLSNQDISDAYEAIGSYRVKTPKINPAAPKAKAKTASKSKKK